MMKLKRNPTWKSKPGNKICVLERGLVRLEYPQHWVDRLDDGSVHLYDRPPSVESCDVGVSVFHVPAREMADADLESALKQSMGDSRAPHLVSAVHRLADAERRIFWMEERYIDKEYKRNARFRASMIAGKALVLLTMNYWENRASGLERIWEEMIRSVIFGEAVEDAAEGADG